MEHPECVVAAENKQTFTKVWRPYLFKHYWVTSPEVGESYDPYRITHCVEAINKTKAKGKFISIERELRKKGGYRDNWIYESGGDNPFVGLEVQDCMCKHGVCNCDLQTPCTIGKPQDPKYDYCGDCILEDNMALWMKEHNVDYDGIRTPMESY